MMRTRFALRAVSLVAAALVGATLTAPRAGAQMPRPNDPVATFDAFGCTEPKHKHEDVVSPLPGAGPGERGPLLVGANAAGSIGFAQRGRDDFAAEATGQLHVAAGRGSCEYGWSLGGDGYVARAFARGAALEASLPALAFGGIAEDRYLGSANVYAGASTASDRAFDPALDLDRVAWGGLTVRLHLPTPLPLPANPPGKITLNVATSAQAEWAWDAATRDRRGASVVPHYGVAVLAPVLRFGLRGLGYSYDRIDRFAGHDAFARHGITFAAQHSFTQTLRPSLRLGLQQVGGRRYYREVALALTTRSFLLYPTTTLGGGHR